MKKAPGPAAEAAAPIRSLAPPPTNMAQANNARGEGKVNTSGTLNSCLLGTSKQLVDWFETTICPS